MFTLASEEKFKDGEIIFKEGSPGDWVYVVLSGTVKVYKMVKGKQFVLAVLKPDDVLGESSFLGGTNKRNATAQAVGETSLGVIDREALDVDFNKISSDFRTLLVASMKRFNTMLERAFDVAIRSEPRLPKTLSLSYRDHQSFIKAYTGNVSSGGLFLRTDNPLAEGETFLLKLNLPGLPDALEINCDVLWTRKKGESSPQQPAGMGVQFGEMSEKDQQALTHYLQNFLKP